MAYPFPAEHLPASLAEWQKIPLTTLAVLDLIPTQYYIRIDRITALASGMPPELADHPHIVQYHGKLYLFDGHHRWTLATIRHTTWLACRVLKMR